MMTQSLGAKRQCNACEAKFYDLNASPVQCPKCKTTLKIQAEKPARAPRAAPAPVKKKIIRPIEVEVEMDTPAGLGSVVELEELDDFEEDLGHLNEVEEHIEEPESDINSDDAEDGMFIDEREEPEAKLLESLEEDEEEK